MKTALNTFLTVACFIISVILSCSPSQPDLSGNSTQIGNGRIMGVIYQPNGTIPAPNAFVHVRKRNTIADVAAIPVKQLIDTVLTDRSGLFTTDSLDTGCYIIEATDGNNNIVLIDSVYVTDTASILLPPATLKPAGAITGLIRLVGGGDPRKVFVLAFGFDRFASVDTNGRFIFDRLAEGRYHLRIISTLDDYGVFDTTTITVISGAVTDIGTISLPFSGISKVKNIEISYDTLKQWVTLKWNRPDAGCANCFNIYRRSAEPTTAVFTQLNMYPVVDTMYIDSFGTTDHTYEYRITGVDSITAREGAKSSGVQVRFALYDITPRNVTMTYDTIHQTVTLRWSNPDTGCVKSYNIYRRNINRHEVFWTTFNDHPLTDTFFIDSTFQLCEMNDPSYDDSTNIKEPSYEYCVAALIYNSREGVRSMGIPVRVSLKYLIPQNIKLSYDTLQQVVFLSWNRPDMTIIDGFTVFRKNIDQNDAVLHQINSSLLHDTICIDSTGEQNKLYEYHVASVVRKSRAIVKSSCVNVRITSYVTEDTVFSNIAGGAGQLFYPNDITVGQNGDIYVVNQGNERILVFDSTMHYKAEIGSTILDYPLKISIDARSRIFASNYDSKRDVSSIFIFDSAGIVIDTILDSTVINDLDVKNNYLYTLTDGRLVSIHSFDGSLIRSWQGCSQNGGGWITAVDPNKIFVSTAMTIPDKYRVTVFDSLGNKLSSLTLSSYPSACAFDEARDLLYIICYDKIHKGILHVFDINYTEIARYKIKSDDQNISICLQKNGALLLVIKGEGTIIRLKSLTTL